MMKPRTIIAVCSMLIVLGLSFSCTKAQQPSLIPADYSLWKTTTDFTLDYPIPGHEDKYRVIHINEKGFGFVRDGGSPERITFPEGTIIAKDIYAVTKPGPDDKPIMVTAMVKAASDPQSMGGWLWVVKDLKMGKESIMTGDFCVRCHDNANEIHPYGWKNPAGAFSDYVFFIPGTDPVM
jgi:hypothetical protein